MKFFDWFTYNANTVGNRPLGVGVGALGFNKPQSDPLYSPYTSRNHVRRSLETVRPSHAIIGRTTTDVALKGNGIALQGTLALTALLDLEKAATK